MAFDNSTIAQPDLHQMAAAKRVPFAADGGGSGRLNITSAWAASELTAGNSKNIFYFKDNGYVSNFSIKASADMDTHATPTLTWDVGLAGVSTTDADEFMAAVTGDEAYAGHDTNVVDESTELGFRVVAGDYITLASKAAAATGAAGNIKLAFDFNAE